MENLKDIKDIVEVSLNSLAILLILSFIAVLILLFLYFKLYLINLNRQQVLLPQKQAFLALENLNFNDAKSCVYQFSQNFIYF